MTRFDRFRLTLGWVLVIEASILNENEASYFLVLPMGIVAILLLLPILPPE